MQQKVTFIIQNIHGVTFLLPVSVGSAGFQQFDACQERGVDKGRSEWPFRCCCEEGHFDRRACSALQKDNTGTDETISMIEALLWQCYQQRILSVCGYLMMKCRRSGGTQAPCGMSTGPQEVLLYTTTGSINKGGVAMPTYRVQGAQHPWSLSTSI